MRGSCRNITKQVMTQWEKADPDVVRVLRDSPSQQQKLVVDSRYLWPTVVFEKVCRCNSNFGGVDCNDCAYGWNGADCDTRKDPVIRKRFSRLSHMEKEDFVNATLELKNEMGYWSVVVEEPANYSGFVTLQNVSTYNFFTYMHSYAARSDALVCKKQADDNITIDFAHAGPVFPVWHRHYLLIVESQFQRIMGNGSFGLPYWQWEENDMSMFMEEYYGTPSHGYSPHDSLAVNVSGSKLNPNTWNTVCDIEYRLQNSGDMCSVYWKACNPAEDLAEQNPLQRGGNKSPYYLPNPVEVKIAISAPSYDAANETTGQFGIQSPRSSFRSRFEGWNIICSAAKCTGPWTPTTKESIGTSSHVHNAVHLWVGGHMGVVPSAINDPVFNLHHCNVDRILESYLQRYSNDSLNPQLLPAYAPVNRGHPGHNRDDYMVPFFPLMKPGDQYRVAREWGYQYDELVEADIDDSDIPDCSDVLQNNFSCPTCAANGTCYNCTESQISECQDMPQPTVFPTRGSIATESTISAREVGLGLGLGLGIPLLIAIAINIVLIAVLIIKNKSQLPKQKRVEIEMTDTGENDEENGEDSLLS